MMPSDESVANRKENPMENTNKIYTAPACEILLPEAADVILTSNPEENNGEVLLPEDRF